MLYVLCKCNFSDSNPNIEIERKKISYSIFHNMGRLNEVSSDDRAKMIILSGKAARSRQKTFT